MMSSIMELNILYILVLLTNLLSNILQVRGQKIRYVFINRSKLLEGNVVACIKR